MNPTSACHAGLFYSAERPSETYGISYCDLRLTFTRPELEALILHCSLRHYVGALHKIVRIELILINHLLLSTKRTFSRQKTGELFAERGEAVFCTID